MKKVTYKSFQSNILEYLKTRYPAPDQEEKEDFFDLMLEEILDNGIADRIIELYALGNSTRQIGDWIRRYFGYQIPGETINLITDCVLPELHTWQNRQLNAVYPIVWVDAIQCKVMNEKNMSTTQTAYWLLAAGCNGYKDILGTYISEDSGVYFWLSVLTDLKKRGVNDILFACTDNLPGFSDAAKSVFPDTVVQTGMVYLIRNSLKDVASKHRKTFVKDLKQVYQAENKETAENKLDKLEMYPGKFYPLIVKSWRDYFHNIVSGFQYPEAVRRMIYATNAVESFYNQIRKIIKNKGIFSNNTEVEKLFYLAYQNIRKPWNMPLSHWKQTKQELTKCFPHKL